MIRGEALRWIWRGVLGSRQLNEYWGGVVFEEYAPFHVGCCGEYATIERKAIGLETLDTSTL